MQIYGKSLHGNIFMFINTFISPVVYEILVFFLLLGIFEKLTSIIDLAKHIIVLKPVQFALKKI